VDRTQRGSTGFSLYSPPPTLAVPLQHPQNILPPLVGSISLPGVFDVLHSAQVRYPVPVQ
jgi:hypothetical protein